MAHFCINITQLKGATNIEINRMQDWIKDLNRLTKQFGVSQEFSLGDFLFTKDCVVEREGLFSREITSRIWPPQSGVYYHYTKREAAESIIVNKYLRLYWVKKRVAESEIRSFLTTCGYKYPLEVDPKTGSPRYEQSLATKFFYMSMTSGVLNNEQEQYFWETFAGRDGARLTLQIRTQAGLLRPMLYGRQLEALAKLICDINTVTYSHLKRLFHWDHAAFVSTLHLPQMYAVEKETRLIVSSEWQLPESTDGSHQYITVPLGRHAILPLTTEVLDVQSILPLPPLPGATSTTRTSNQP